MRIPVLLCLASVACADGAFCVDWSPDGKWIAVGREHSVELRDAKTQAVSRTIESWSTVHAVRFGKDSKDLLFAGKGNTFTIVGIDGKPVTAPGEVNPVVGFSAARSTDGRTVVSVSAGNDLLVWKPPFDKPVRTLKGADHVWKYAITPDGARAFAVNREGKLTTWDVESGKRLVQVDAHEGYVFAMEMNEQGTLLATGGSADDRTVALWDPLSLRLDRRIDVKVIVRALAFSNDGKLLAVAGDEKRVDVFEIATGERRETVRLPWKPSAVAFSPDGKRLLILDVRGRSKIHEFLVGEEKRGAASAK